MKKELNEDIESESKYSKTKKTKKSKALNEKNTSEKITNLFGKKSNNNANNVNNVNNMANPLNINFDKLDLDPFTEEVISNNNNAFEINPEVDDKNESISVLVNETEKGVTENKVENEKEKENVTKEKEKDVAENKEANTGSNTSGVNTFTENVNSTTKSIKTPKHDNSFANKNLSRKSFVKKKEKKPRRGHSDNGIESLLGNGGIIVITQSFQPNDDVIINI